MKTTMKKIAAYLLALMLVLQMVPALADDDPIVSKPTGPITAFRLRLEISAPKSTLTVGEQIQLTVTDNYDEVRWESKDKEVATVDQDGLVTAKAPGSVKIIARDSGYSDSITLRVVDGNGKSAKTADGTIVVYITGEKAKVTYNGSAYELGYTVSSESESFDESKLHLVNEAKKLSETNCGTYTQDLAETDFEYDGDEAIVYDITNGWLQIKPAQITLIVDDKEINEGEAYPEFTATASGLLGNDTLDLTGVEFTVTEDNKIVPNVEPGNILGNYRVQSVMAGKLTVNKNTAKYNGTYLLGMVGVTGGNGLLTSEVRSDKRLKMVNYTESAESGLIEEPSQLSYWKFEMQPSGNYYISSDGKYLNIKGSAISMTGTPQELIIEDAGNGKIAIMNSDKYRLNLKSETIKNGVQGSTWNTSKGLDPAFNESFKLYRGVYSNVPQPVEQPLYNMLTMTGDGNYYRLRKTTITTATLYTTLEHGKVITDYEMTPYDFTNLVLYDKDNEPYVYSDHEMTGDYVSYYTIELQAVKKEDRINQNTDWFNDPTGWLDGSKEQYGNEDKETPGYHANYKATLHKGLTREWNEEEMSISITSNWPAGKPGYRDAKITLTAHLTGFEGRLYKLQWQYKDGSGNWIDITGANGLTYTYTLNEETTNYSWRVVANPVNK